MNHEQAQAWLDQHTTDYTISNTGPTGQQVSVKVKATGRTVVLNLSPATLAPEVHMPMLVTLASRADSSGG